MGTLAGVDATSGKIRERGSGASGRRVSKFLATNGNTSGGLVGDEDEVSLGADLLFSQSLGRSPEGGGQEHHHFTRARGQYRLNASCTHAYA